MRPAVFALALATLVAAAASTAHADEEAVQAPARPSRNAPLLRLDLAYASMHASSIPITAGALTLGAGANLGRYAGLGGELRGTVGETEFGRKAGGAAMAFFAEGVMSRVRLGGGFSIGYFGVQRVTRGSDFGSLTLGLGLHISLDLIQDDRSALYLVGRAQGSLTEGAPLGALTIGLGYRL